MTESQTNLPIRLCLAIHNHQPIGNFDDVFESAYCDSYLPFLDLFEPYEHLKISLHISGSLIEWLDHKHPDYLDRIRDLVDQERIEILGGAFYEPILTMLPSRDRIGQIQSYTTWLQNRLGCEVRGMWVPERVWESCLAGDLGRASIEYTILDDFHFRCAGQDASALHGFFVTEDEGQVVKVFPGSEKLRYLIPFCEPEQTVEFLRELHQKHPGAVAVFGDDGEKFGTWPETKTHVYENGWLKRFFDLLSDNRNWLSTCTLAEAIDHTAPQGKVYLPDASYREMTEWALPVDLQIKLHELMNQLEHDERGQQAQQFIRGGVWRNFKSRYPESNEIYARMIHVSNQLQQAEISGTEKDAIQRARTHLYRGQCNCTYWHGAFGGLYLPHLRNAVYHELIRAEQELDQAQSRNDQWIDAQVEDFDFDGLKEIKLANNALCVWLAPGRGGQMYELDVKSVAHNLLATMQRRPEAYHEKVKSGGEHHSDETASIHDRVVFKQEGLDERLQYDDRLRKSLIDCFWENDVSREQVELNQVQACGDFADQPYQSRIRRGNDRVQIQMSRKGNAKGIPLTLTKAVTLSANSDSFEVTYMIEGLPADGNLKFGVECNFAGMPANADDRYFTNSSGENLGHLGSRLDLPDQRSLNLYDNWQQIQVSLEWDQPTSVWTFPVETVSQSEAGFELVHQSTAVIPSWLVSPDENGRWIMTMKIGCHHLKKNQPKQSSTLVETPA